MTRPADQVAALPIRRGSRGQLQVLLVTSRRSGRWVVPKGWPMPGKEPWEAAKIEAMEEAGAEGLVATEAIGAYSYDKRLDEGGSVPCRVSVFPMLVRGLKRTWPEQGERRRRWFSPAEAARSVNEPELSALLYKMADSRQHAPAVHRLLKAS